MRQKRSVRTHKTGVVAGGLGGGWAGGGGVGVGIPTPHPPPPKPAPNPNTHQNFPNRGIKPETCTLPKPPPSRLTIVQHTPYYPPCHDTANMPSRCNMSALPWIPSSLSDWTLSRPEKAPPDPAWSAVCWKPIWRHIPTPPCRRRSFTRETATPPVLVDDLSRPAGADAGSDVV